MSIRSSRTFTFSPPGDTRYPQERTSELVHTVRDLMDRYGSIEFASEFAEGIRLVAEGTSSRPSLTQNPDRTAPGLSASAGAVRVGALALNF